MAADLPFTGSPVVPEMCDGSKMMQFQCRKGIACWNACCSNIDISLTPYDILRLKQRLGISFERIPASVHRAIRNGTEWHRRREITPRGKRHSLPVHDTGGLQRV